MKPSDSRNTAPDSGITDATTPISKLKSPMPLSFVKGAWNTISQAHLMTGGDESIYYATHFHTTSERPWRCRRWKRA